MKNAFFNTNHNVEEIKPEYFDNGKVICQHCKKPFNIISPTHLKKEHNSTVEKYKKDFPDAPLSSQQFKAKQRFHAAELFSDKNPDKKPEEFFFQDLVVKKEEEAKNEEEILNNLKKDIDMSVLMKEVKFKDKLDLFLCIRKRFPSLVNNYTINIIALNGILTFSSISDMADPVNKIDFEFPSAHWHNQDRGVDVNRNTKLERYGWKVYTFKHIPSITELEDFLTTVFI